MTTMLRLDRQQRAALGEMLRELANLAAAALVLGELVTDSSPSLRLMLFGTALWGCLADLGVLFAGERRWKTR